MVKTSLAFVHITSYYNEILIERAYSNDILYVNLTEEEEFLLDQFNKTNIYEFNQKYDYLRKTDNWLNVDSIYYFRRFVKLTKIEDINLKNIILADPETNNQEIYVNSFTYQYFSKTELIIKNNKFFVNET